MPLPTPAARVTRTASQSREGAGDLMQATLDTLSAQIAVLGEDGRLIATNAAWERFAAESGSPAGIGENLLAALDAAAPADAHAAELAAALRSVLAGERDGAQLEAGVPGPPERRWLSVKVTRSGPKGAGVVVQREDVTARRSAEGAARLSARLIDEIDRDRAEASAQLRIARDHLRMVADSLGDGIFAVDGSGRLTFVNGSAERLLGWTAEELLGRVAHDVVHHRRPDGSPFPESQCPVSAVRAGDRAVHVAEDVFVRKDGTALPVSYRSAPIASDGDAGGAVVVFSDRSERREVEPGAAARDLEALTWIGRIRDALEQDRFVLYAQPIIELASGATVQHELLIRMLDDDGGIVAPGLFLPVAEEYGLIREIDRWVVRQAARLAAEGRHVEVNLSAESLSDPGLYGFVEQELAEAGADPANLVFELTETALLRDESSACRFIEGVDRLGSHVALDDFGTGYGGFTYVKRLPIDFLKIDVEFVRDLPQNPASQHVVRAVVNLARDFGHKTVAEGVEDDETLELLRQFGVDYAQGYGIGRPAPLEQALAGR